MFELCVQLNVLLLCTAKGVVCTVIYSIGNMEFLYSCTCVLLYRAQAIGNYVYSCTG